jgi:hypothetical protein
MIMDPEKKTPDIVIKYREVGRTLTQQVEWEKIADLRDGNLHMTLPNSDHFSYVKKFLQPLLLEPIPGVKGVVSLSSRMARGDTYFRMVTHWPIMNVRKSFNNEDWLFALGGEIK